MTKGKVLRIARSTTCLVAACVGLSLIAGCANKRGGTIAYDPANFVAPDPISVATLGADYKIAPLDKLTVKVYKFDDLSGEYDVDLLGNIALPLIGTVRAATLSPDELKAVLVERFGAKYIQAPDVNVGIKESAGSVVTVQGAVKQPGLYPAIGSMSLLQAVATARGVDEGANPRRVAIFRTIGGKRNAAAFDLLSIQHGEMADPPVYRGDIIVVDGSSAKSSWRNILQTIPVLALFNPLL